MGPLRSSSADSTEASAATGSRTATAHSGASLEAGAGAGSSAAAHASASPAAVGSASTAHRRQGGPSADPAPPQPPLQALHLAAVGLMVVAEAVQQAMEQQHLDLARRIAAGRRRL